MDFSFQRQHKKRPSSTFASHSRMPLDHHLQGPDKDSSSSSSPHAESSPDLHIDIGYQYQQPQQQSPIKRRTMVHKPWSKSEQESLYIAVERLGLFGQWELVQQRMNLDRSPTEIQNEYTRIYAELPNTDDEDDGDSDVDFQDERPDDQSQEERNLELELEWRLAQRLDGSSISSSSNGARTREIECNTASAACSLATPALTTTSSTPSARSSQDNIAQLYDQSKRSERYDFPEVTRKVSPEEDEDVEEEEDEEDQEQEEDDQVSKKDEKLNALATISSASISTETRPPRMIRVWTPEQSENLKNLIEVSFPGSYRINWVWVAAQMGNAFTRKQCKNKWEIMRRRMGTEDEIQLLRRGYQEFGPSWGQIQEKYLPERSRGGISIMWDLLESRGAEQQTHSGPKHHSHRRGVSMSSTTAPYPRPTLPLHSSIQDQYQDTFRRTRTATSDAAVDQGSRQLMRGRLQATVGRHRASSSLDMSDTLRFGSMTSREQGHHHPIGPGGVSDNLPNGARNLSQPSLLVHKRHGSETWIDRSLPMTWTEPLSKQLEELVQRHFPHPQKVNWAKISALMGTNPIVSREQCKRRWYLISQSHQQSHLSAHLSYASHHQLSPQRRPLHQQLHSHQTGFVGSHGPLQAPAQVQMQVQGPDCYAMDIDGHY